MADSAITTATTAANLLVSRWAASIRIDAQEEMVVADGFNDGRDVERIGDTLYVRKIAAISAATTTTGQGLTYTANTEARVSVTPTWAYAAVVIARSVYNRMDQSPDNPYRKQLAAGLAAYIDQQAANLATGLSTNNVGSGAVDLDYTLVTALMGKIITSSKNHFKAGSTGARFIFHPAQYQYIMGQTNFIADYVKGNDESSVESGWVAKGTGFRFSESGNILQSAGVTYNMAYTDDALILAYNEEPTVLPPQDYEISKRIIATAEFGVQEVYDAYAGVAQTRA